MNPHLEIVRGATPDSDIDQQTGENFGAERDIAILISTHDGARSMWKPLAQNFKRYWPDCPFTIYLSTNHLDAGLDVFHSLNVGREASWSDNISKCLEKIPEPYILLTYDDLFLQDKIVTKRVNDIASLMIKNRWDYLRLNPAPLPDIDVNPEIGKILPGSLYRTAGVWALFEKKVFQELLDVNESAWEFELIACDRSDKFEHFYGIKSQLFPYVNSVVKGKWVPSAFLKLQADGFDVRAGDIPLMNAAEQISYFIIKVRSMLFSILIPKKHQRFLRQLILKRQK